MLDRKRVATRYLLRWLAPLALVACQSSDVRKVTLVVRSPQAASRILCVDGQGQSLAERNGIVGQPFRAILDFVDVHDVLRCRVGELRDACAAAGGCPVELGLRTCINLGNGSDFLHGGTGGATASRSVVRNILDTLRQRLTPVPAPDGTVIVRLVLAAGSCTEPFPADPSLLAGCGYSCPVSLRGLADGAKVELDLDASGKECDVFVKACAQDKAFSPALGGTP